MYHLKTEIYIITQNSNESYQQYLTRVANEIQNMNVKICNMDIDIRGYLYKTIITYQNKI